MSAKIPPLDTDAIPLTKEDIKRRSLPMTGVVTDEAAFDRWARDFGAALKQTFAAVRPQAETCGQCSKPMVACECDLEKIAQFTKEMEEGKLKTPEQVAEMLKLALRHMPQERVSAGEPLTFPDLSSK